MDGKHFTPVVMNQQSDLANSGGFPLHKTICFSGVKNNVVNRNLKAGLGWGGWLQTQLSHNCIIPFLVAKHMMLGEAGLALQITECKETDKPRGQSYGAGDPP